MRATQDEDIGNIPHMRGNNTALAYDLSEPIERTQFVCYKFTPFKESMLHIYMDLVNNAILASLYDDDNSRDLVGGEIVKPCAYHDAINYSISKCFVFHYDLESPVNMENIIVEFIPRD